MDSCGKGEEGRGIDLESRALDTGFWLKVLCTVYKFADEQTVAGGITAGMRPLETMIKECDEEANLPEDFVRARLKWVIFPCHLVFCNAQDDYTSLRDQNEHCRNTDYTEMPVW